MKKLKKVLAVIIAVFIILVAGKDFLPDEAAQIITQITDLAQDTGSDETDSASSESNSSESSSADSEMIGDYYSVVGEAEADTSVEVGEVVYSGFDSLGRTLKVSACVTYDMVKEASESERESMSDIYPSGWTTNTQVTITFDDGTVYNGYFWNRSHLLAFSLGGDFEQHNLITATRAQNVGKNDQDGGMAYGETLVRNWIWDNEDGYVYYSAEPIYDGDDLVAKTVEVNMLSSDGTINEKVIVYNECPGYTIDYATGEYTED